MEPREERTDAIAKLRMLRDQIRVDLHLAKMDARTRWGELEKRFQEVEHQARSRAAKSTRKVSQLIKDLEVFRDALRS
jgi:hypothetical protein